LEVMFKKLDFLKNRWCNNGITDNINLYKI